MVVIHLGVNFLCAVQHVAEACNREQEHAAILLRQMVAKTAASLERLLSQETVAATHVQVRLALFFIIIYMSCGYLFDSSPLGMF